MRNRRRVQRRGPLIVYHKDQVSIQVFLNYQDLKRIYSDDFIGPCL